MRKSFIKNEDGAAVVEFALALPILISFIFGIFQLALVFWANAGAQHAMGEAARYATLYPTPTAEQVEDFVASSTFGTHNGTMQTPTVTQNATDGYFDIEIVYTQPTDFIFFEGPVVDIEKAKRVYYSN
ncbi:TadE/TadG family type IV pilus assembly protein [Sphingomicrobium flavum]|uniref:TadE/TadG family type IV pilus assembly protein n=1 Tax=Sphingomicrobium flavum TaxID=1229164 RepID=UPI0021ADF489|nr:TadE family protein [Sphingomicrobium flavum]